MNLEFVREFCTLAEEGNFTEAADRLYISQSTLSRHIRVLETELGIELFARNGKIVTINEYGKRFLPYAKRIMDVQAECEEAYFEELRKLNDDLTIGLFSLDSNNPFANLAFEFKESHANYNILLIEGPSDSLRNQVSEGSCDIAVVLSTGTLDESFKCSTVGRDVLSLLLPAEHPLAARKSLTIDKLQKEKFIIPSGESAEKSLCLLAAKDAGFNPQISCPTLSIKSLIRFIERGHGIAFKPKSFSEEQNPNIAALDLEPEYEILINIIYRKDTPLTELGRNFIKTLQEFGS